MQPAVNIGVIEKHRVEGERDDQEPKKTDFWDFVPGE
jgi:hypothetical protein